MLIHASKTIRTWQSCYSVIVLLPNLRQLHYWLAVIEEQSFTAAARRLSVSQPALSRQIKELERQLGGELIERLPGGVRPTAAGRALLPEARTAIAAAERAARTVRESLGLEAGVLELATLPTLAAGQLLPCIQQWHTDHPRVTIRLREFSYRTLLQDSVAAGVGDLGVGTRPQRWNGPQEYLGWEELALVLPAWDPLLEHEAPVPIEQLSEREWVLYDRRQGLSDVVLAACTRAGFQPRGVVETMQPEVAARFAAAGMGPALVPVDNVPDDLATCARPLEVPLGYEITAYTRTSWSPAAMSFVEIMRLHMQVTRPDGAIVL